MKNIISLTTAICLLFCNPNFAQITIVSGTVTDQAIPIEPYYGFTYSQVIYLASEIGASGNITGVKYYATSLTTLTNSNDWTVYIGHTTKPSFASTSDWEAVTGLTQVFTGTATITGGEVIGFFLSSPLPILIIHASLILLFTKGC